MIEELMRARIQDYGPANALEQENLLQEMMQQIVLTSLARAGFFSEAIFHGGSSLHILFGMPRFSEDLDFLLRRVDATFRWGPYLTRVGADCAEEGIHLEIQDRHRADATVKKAFLKTDSIGKILLFDLPFSRHVSKKLRIKLEIDTNPPAGSSLQTSYLSFPTSAALTTQTLESSFGTKSHALLCRSYTKGRDWYDFIWYVSRKIVPNLTLLQNALFQQGPWAGQQVAVSGQWYVEAMRTRIEQINWAAARDDVIRFLTRREQDQVALWSPDFFLFHLEQVGQNLLTAV